MATKKPPTHTITSEDLDRLIRIVAGSGDDDGDPASANLIERCRAIKPGHIVEVEARGKVQR